MFNKPPCGIKHPCPDRTLGCHSTCKEFLTWLEAERVKREKYNLEKDVQRNLTAAEIERNNKLKAKNYRKNRRTFGR